MLRIHTSTSAASAKSYFNSADYYSEGQELIGVWRGEGAKRLGLNGEIQKRDWERLCDNRDPNTGKSLTVRRKDNRRIGWDMTFDCPKSLSLVYGLTGDERLLDAFRSSVRETMQEIESEAKARVRQDGANEDRTTGNLCWGEYVHLTSRPVDGVPDPQLHAHCFVFNATWDDRESRFKAAQISDIKSNAPYYQAKCDSYLAMRLADLGLAVERSPMGWQLQGFDRSTVEKFSRRTKQIEELARRKGITDPHEKASLGAKIRAGKAKHLSMGELRQEWKGRLSGDEQTGIAQIALAIGSPRIGENDLAMKESVQRAIDHCFQRSAVLPDRLLMAEALRQSTGLAVPNKVAGELAKRPFIVREYGGRTFVTLWEVLREEDAMVDFARDGRGTCRQLGPKDYAPKRTWLSEEQKRAVQHVLTSPDRVILVRGAAGTGKTTLMQEAADGIKAGGREVFTFAPSTSASRSVLREAGFENAETVARLLVDSDLQERARNQVLWVDEAGLLGSRTTKQLFDVAERIHARVILSGDRRQHGSVERGGTLKLLEQAAGLIPAELRQIRRQRGEYKQAVEALSEGRVAEAFARLDDLKWIKEISGSERYKALAAAYVESIRQPGETLVVCPTDTESDRITGEIRRELKANRTLSADEREFTILRTVSLTEAQRRDPASYRPGDTLVFHQNARGYTKGTRFVVGRGPIPLDQADRFTVYRPGAIRLAPGDRVRITKNSTSADRSKRLNNGDLATVARFTPDGMIVLYSGAVLAHDFGHLDFGYVVTSHASQGKSVERVIIGQSSASHGASSMAQAYVSISRGKKRALIFTDDKEALLEAVGKSDDRMTATELVHGRSHRQRQQANERATGLGPIVVPPRRVERQREEFIRG